MATIRQEGLFARCHGHHHKGFRSWRRAYAEFDRVAEWATWVRLQGVGLKFILEWTEV